MDKFFPIHLGSFQGETRIKQRLVLKANIKKGKWKLYKDSIKNKDKSFYYYLIGENLDLYNMGAFKDMPDVKLVSNALKKIKSGNIPSVDYPILVGELQSNLTTTKISRIDNKYELRKSNEKGPHGKFAFYIIDNTKNVYTISTIHKSPSKAEIEANVLDIKEGRFITIDIAKKLREYFIS